jgi:phosphate transport system permease protein
MPTLSSPRQGADVAAAMTQQRLTSTKRDIRGAVFHGLLVLSLVMAMLILLLLVWDMWSDGREVLTTRLGDFLTSDLSTNPNEAGVAQGIFGTIMLCVIVAIVAFPLGIACAVYLEEYASGSQFARWTQVNVRNLAGVPSIVYGILGLAVFVQLLGDNGNGGLTGGRSLISGGLTLALLVLPVVVITTSEALRAVPRGIREGALALGSTPWEMIRKQVLPAAGPGILTGTVISLARAAGEAAPLILVGAVTGIFSSGDQNFVEQLRGRFTAMPIIIFSWARNPNSEFVKDTGAAAIVLLVLIFIMNGIAIWLRNRYERKW